MSGGWILAFDTATRATAVALCGANREQLEARDDQPPGVRPQHAAKLLPLCAQVLDAAGVSFEELDRVAVGIGPGTFTGLRIGVATARALSRAADVGLVGVSTLASVALNAWGAPEIAEADGVMAVLDARRGEVFAAGWAAGEPRGDARVEPHGDALLEPAALSPQALAEEVQRLGARVLALGEGAIAFRQVLERSGAFVPDDESALHRVSAVNHCRIARDLEPSNPDQVTPEYLRLPDAELARRAAGNQ
jgi:tRNA threonylcarbamoyladenosine biosynthesis protein TsaB